MQETGMPTYLQWSEPWWLEQAHHWIRNAAAQADLDITAAIETVHHRLWSIVMRCPTATGVLYFKACEPRTEPRLTVYLRGFQAENLPDLVAVDLDRGWMLMRDAGVMLRTHLKTPGDLAMMDPALDQFAQLQIALVPHSEQLLTLGALDRRLEHLPDMFAGLLDDAALLRLGCEDGLSAGQHAQLRSLLPEYTRICKRLLQYGIPQTLHHDDFHDGNTFILPVDGAFRFTFSDWGESCYAHPFFSIMLLLRSLGWSAGFPDEATATPEGLPPELMRLRDVYLRSWDAYESSPRLVEAFNLAWRAGMVSRALSWSEYVHSLPEDARADFTYIVPAWLNEFLLAMKPGS